MRGRKNGRQAGRKEGKKEGKKEGRKEGRKVPGCHHGAFHANFAAGERQVGGFVLPPIDQLHLHAGSDGIFSGMTTVCDRPGLRRGVVFRHRTLHEYVLVGDWRGEK
jgi:hypothetical protein